MVRASEANAAGLEAAAGDSRADRGGTEGRAGEHLDGLISAIAYTSYAFTDLGHVEEKLM